MYNDTTIKLAANIALQEAGLMRQTGLKHPEDSAERDRCFARARTASHIAKEITSLGDQTVNKTDPLTGKHIK